MMNISWIVLCICVVVFTTIAAVWDVRAKKIPNVLTVSGLVAALVFHLINGAVQGGLTGAGQSLLVALGGFATGFSILFVLWLIGGGGGGDVKLMGAIGAWLGPENTLIVFMISSLLVGVGTMTVLAWRFARAGFRRPNLTGETYHWEGRKKVRGHRPIMPYGVPVALATWCVLAFPNLYQLIRETIAQG
jgi:prepilin peptidase CpaA